MNDPKPPDYYDEGYNAYWNGREQEENPYERKTEAFGLWEDGWHEARDQD